MILARNHPNVLVSCCSPGFVDTHMTEGMGATKPASEGTHSIMKCLFDELKGSGFYYGSDGLRSPLKGMRNPGEPEYNGQNDRGSLAEASTHNEEESPAVQQLSLEEQKKQASCFF